MSEIKPALTEEEWAEGEARRGFRAGKGDDGYVFVQGEHGGVSTREPATLHAIAALALLDQPFGFTWDDVDVLREAAADPEMWSGRDKDADLRDLADRIEALLPPRSTP